MRIVVHGQQAFGKAVLEALIKRGENVVGVYVAPGKGGCQGRPGQGGGACRQAARLSAGFPQKAGDVFDCLRELADPDPTTFRCW